MKKFNGVKIVKNVISEEMVNFLTQYCLFDEMKNFNEEKDLWLINRSESHSKYADPAMETLLLNLLPIMEINTNLELLPTYSYYRIYRSFSLLNKHKDRESCEISSSLCINFSYDKNNYSWPLFIDENPIVINPGDMVIYKGIDFEHYRPVFFPPSENDWHIQVFLHYVDKNGPYKSFKYDKRNSIGE